MQTFTDNMIQLETVKQSIINAIIDKGGEAVSSYGFNDLPSAVLTIPVSSPVVAFLYVKANANTTVNAINDGTLLTQTTDSSGTELLFEIPNFGTWNITTSTSTSDQVSISDKIYYHSDVRS